MPYLDINLGKIITFGDILKFVEKLQDLNIEKDTPAYIMIDDKIVNVVDMGTNEACIVFSNKKLK